MARSTQLAVLSLVLALACPAIAAERCAVLFETTDGEIEHAFLESLSVAELAQDQAFSLPPDAPPKVRSIQCGRETLVPGDNDLKVLRAGYPISIVANGRVGVLELVAGQLRFRMLSGDMTEPESILMQRTLNKAQDQLQGRALVAPK